MPGFVTHYLFGFDTFRKITDPSVRSSIRNHPTAYSLGLQGPDVFFYYPISYLIHPRNIGNIAHDTETGRFFAALLKARARLVPDSAAAAIADAYLLGFIGHYTLDTHAHPYVYARTKYDPDHKPSQKDYFGQHAYLETELDNELLMRDKGLVPSDFHMERTIRLSFRERSVIADLLTQAYRDTYQTAYPTLKVKRHQVKSAALWMYHLTMLMRDPSGKKKALVRLLEGRFIGKPTVSAMIPSDYLTFALDPLNLAHRTWKHPWTKESTRASFEDLFDQAMRCYLNRISLYRQWISTGHSTEAETVLLADYGNRSFSSGLTIEN